MAGQLFGVQEGGIGIAVVGSGHCNWVGLVRRQTSSRVRAGAQNSTRLLECDGPWAWAMDVRALLVLLRIARWKNDGQWTRYVAKSPCSLACPDSSRVQCPENRRQATSAGEDTGTGVKPIGNRDGATQSFGTRSQAVERLSRHFFSGFVAATEFWISCIFWRAVVQVECGKP